MLLLATAADLQAMLANKTLTSRELVKQCLERIARHNGYLKAVIALPTRELLYQNAELLDQERAAGKIRGPLHGIPILLKVHDPHPRFKCAHRSSGQHCHDP